MQRSIEDVIEQCARAAHDGSRAFPAIVGALMEAGVEAYQADYRRRATTYYVPDAGAHSVALDLPEIAIPARFDALALQEAIRGSQRGEVKYHPEFLQRSMAAGCVGYVVWIAGRQVTYFGRHGEVHVEKFPSPA